MRYCAELYYFQDDPTFDFKKAVQITAAKVSEWCEFYYAKCYYTDPTHSVETGPFPSSARRRVQKVFDLLDFIQIWEHPQVSGLFMDSKPFPEHPYMERKEVMFDHHDDTSSWVLNLSENQFHMLQSSWIHNGLPEDLFYEDRPKITEQIDSSSYRVYTPKQWEMHTKQHLLITERK